MANFRIMQDGVDTGYSVISSPSAESAIKMAQKTLSGKITAEKIKEELEVPRMFQNHLVDKATLRGFRNKFV